ncbi:MAG: RidA family protein [bacterium]|nr:RidA family protein [bacterium]
MTRIDYINPEGLHQNPAFTQVVAIEPGCRTVYVGGQNAVNAGGEIVGPDDLAAQSEQVARNVQTALAAAGARPEHVVQWTIYLLAGQSPQVAFQGFGRVWGQTSNPPTISVVQVAGLAHPQFLIEVAAVAAVPV